MSVRLLFPCLSLLVASAVSGCKKPDASPTATSASASPPTPAVASATKRALATPAAPSAARLVHTKVTMDECTFDLDAPEALEKSTSDEVSVTFDGKTLSFRGFVGASLDNFDLVASTAKPADTLYYDKEGDPQLVVSRVATPSTPLHEVMGNGNERRPEDRKSGLGCAFMCTGTRAAEGDVLAMCRSVKISYDAKKAK